MKKLLLSAGLSILSLCAACGGGGGPAPRPVGNFSNASLSGQYAYQITGFEFTSGGTFLLKEAGVFTADGQGRITAGTDDYQGASSYSSGSISGTYTISKDGTGQVNIQSSDGGVLDLSVTLASSSKVYLQVAQTTTSANGSGIAERQSASAFASTPSGVFAFQQHKYNTNDFIAQAGVFGVANGTIVGTSDLDVSGSIAISNLTGTLSAPDVNGRGTGVLQDSTGSSTHFAYYVVDANNLRFFSTDNGTLGLGRAELQTSAALSDASFNGGYAFGSRGDDFSNNGISGVNTVGRFTADGAGGITAGAYDSVQDGNSVNNAQFTGTYTVDSSIGRAEVTLNPTSGGAIHQIYWIVGPNRAFLLTDDASKIEDGTVDAQQSSSFSNGSLTGQFAFFMNGFNLNLNSFYVDRVGTLQWDGAGNLTLAEYVNNGGNVSTSGSLTGNYTAAANGRVVSSVSNLTNNLIFYLVSGSDGYILQNDPGVEIIGHMTAQP